MNTFITPTWLVRSVGIGFAKAWGRRKPTKLEDSIDKGALMLTVDFAGAEDIVEARTRTARVGRMLADEAMRKKIRRFAPLPPVFPEGWVPGIPTPPCVLMTSKEQGVAFRLTEFYSSEHKSQLYRVDMLGARGLK